jgi:chemotaxis signal transduction protein
MEEFRPLQLKHYLIFKIADEKFAIDILDVESIHASRRKAVFEDMDDLRTAIKIYKRLIPVINLRKSLRLKGDKPLQPSLIFLACKDINDPIVGVQVDEIVEIVETMVPKKSNGKSTRLIKAMCGFSQEVLMVLRLKDIIDNDEIVNRAVSALN